MFSFDKDEKNLNNEKEVRDSVVVYFILTEVKSDITPTITAEWNMTQVSHIIDMNRKVSL